MCPKFILGLVSSVAWQPQSLLISAIDTPGCPKHSYQSLTNFEYIYNQCRCQGQRHLSWYLNYISLPSETLLPYCLAATAILPPKTRNPALPHRSIKLIKDTYYANFKKIFFPLKANFYEKFWENIHPIWLVNTSTRIEFKCNVLVFAPKKRR